MRTLAQRFAFVTLLAGAVGIMVVGKADPRVFERVRVSVTDFAAPILDTLSRPVEAIENAVYEVRQLADLRGENARLRAENESLREWEAEAHKLEAENRQLRDLLNYRRDDVARFITARVIGDTGGAFVRSFLVNEGRDRGVRNGQAAVVGEGLVGRVASVGNRSARILMITDLNSRIPVVIESTRTRAVLAGDNTPSPRLIYLSANADLEVGQRVVTSGHGGVFAPGIPVGKIISVGDAGVRIKPFVDLDRLEYVRLMDFGLNGVLQDADPLEEGRKAGKAGGD